MFTRLYIHIPFCRQKCHYCAFFSQKYVGDGLNHYAELLCTEMSLVAEKTGTRHKLDSIYFGGGTPSLMDFRQVARLIEQAEHTFGLAAQAEITLEANPGTVDYHRLADFRRAGVNRLSLGIQSFNDRMLATLGRIHTAQEAREAFAAARRAGFKNIGIDLINSLPGQTRKMWRTDLEQALQLAPEHLSVYGLTIEEDTRFAAQYAENSPLLPDEDLSAVMFEMADDLLGTLNYEHYEIANYALPGFRGRHNSGYWKRDGYLGLGAGAHSYLQDTGGGVRFSNIADLNAYTHALHQAVLPRTDIMPLSRTDALAEYMFLGLRMSDGIVFETFEKEFGIELKDVFGQELELLQSQQLLSADTTAIRLTRRGMLLSNQVFRCFLP
ncbi:MAG: radical SAM family heme chaperone HemW [Verrucomicrobia bacterium]|nr:radical SAM family heme chaperone HemW [Deltaproteobacteria bacterium]